jgi:hypothetical protein
MIAGERKFTALRHPYVLFLAYPLKVAFAWETPEVFSIDTRKVVE